MQKAQLTAGCKNQIHHLHFLQSRVIIRTHTQQYFFLNILRIKVCIVKYEVRVARKMYFFFSPYFFVAWKRKKTEFKINYEVNRILRGKVYKGCQFRIERRKVKNLILNFTILTFFLRIGETKFEL